MLLSCVIVEEEFLYLPQRDYIGVVDMATPARPLVLPDPFNGSGESSWTEWKCHFDNITAVNENSNG